MATIKHYVDGEWKPTSLIESAVAPDLDNYVQKDGNKVLSDNNYSDDDKSAVETIPTITQTLLEDTVKQNQIYMGLGQTQPGYVLDARSGRTLLFGVLSKCSANAFQVILPAEDWMAFHYTLLDDTEEDWYELQITNLTYVHYDSQHCHLIVTPANNGNDIQNYAENNIFAYQQGAGSISFRAVTKPEVDITVNILVINTDEVPEQ